MPGFGGLEAPNWDGSRDSRDHLPSLMTSCYPITLKFMDVCYKVKVQGSDQEKTILNNITGMVSPGEMLAILGPSGSGKSTLLNALAGRLQHGYGSFSGTMLANNRKLSKQIAKRTGFVTQDDVLYPHLTVRETLVFCSLLRLPKTLSAKDKISVAETVLLELGLSKCENTIIGNSFIRGISGGERKRVSIAHEMLINPSLLILDEPTSGLDSTAAHRLVSILGSLTQKGKTIVTSMHQPSSRVYQLFDSVLLLSEGRSLYFGKGSEAMGYFESIGFSPSFPMNPADFLLDLANGVCKLDGVSESERPNVKQTLVASYNTLLAPKVKAACMETTPIPAKGSHFVGSHCSEEGRSSNRFDLSTWFYQFTILLQRSLKERKQESFNTLRVFQVMTAAMLAGLMWWHSDYQDIQDRLGLLFFISIFWGVLPSFNAVFAFPQERAIFMKERASGMYTLSSYYMARITGDLPMELILPTVFLLVTYWMTGLKPDLVSFLLTLLVLLGYVLVSQGLGLALGALIMDSKQASTIVTVTMLAFVLTGGYYVHKMPSCVTWIKYASTTYYSFKLFINVQYGDGEKVSSLLGCSHHGSNTVSCKLIDQDIAGQTRPELSVGILILMFVGYRLLAYLALRRIKG
ncbi:ABC transporter G family member 25 [Hibiscus syriacus]|uniref:ABC transporter G family member 25 n=1 Tax=Hibiscus syriacus TaxID=106335 RepID=A0A6A3B1P1_HIBSY|nr:ABC transporter G family member 25-like [Hibiscus syriacus]KAE8709798.1 ABC transporter G family member 25 [Hibiscus syriacus]